MYVYVVKGVISGWKMSVAKVITGGANGYADGKCMRKRNTA